MKDRGCCQLESEEKNGFQQRTEVDEAINMGCHSFYLLYWAVGNKG